MKKDNGWAWFKRRTNDPEILSHIEDIVKEGFDYVEPCEFVNQFDTYLGTVVYGSALTFINSYEELYEVSPPVQEYIYDFIESKFKSFIKENYNYWISECEEDIYESKNITINENINFIRRRLSQFIEIVENQYKGYEQNEDGAWWCRHNNPDTFLEDFRDRVIEDFVNKNWYFFHDDSERGGANMDISILYKIVEEEYGNDIKNLFVRKCNYSRY